MKMLGRKMRRERTHINDYDSAPNKWNRVLRRVQRKREKQAWKRINGEENA